MPRAIRKETIPSGPVNIPLHPGGSKPRAIKLAIRLVEGMSLHWDPKHHGDEEGYSDKIVNLSDYLCRAARKDP